MASVLHVNAITGTTGVGSQAGSPIQISGDTATLGSAVTFPTGNVINLEIKTGIPASAHTLSTTDSYLTGLKFTYSVKKQTSKLYIQFNPLFQTEHDGTNYSYKLSLRSSVDSYTSSIGGGNVPNIVHYGSTGQVLWTQFPVCVSCFHDHNQTAGTTIEYRLFGRVNANTKGIYAWDSWGHTAEPATSQHAIIYEIEQ
tara:strand:- start:126 stop:719 length:594 start_codon:yes stop_codon:yes gene_type:complete